MSGSSAPWATFTPISSQPPQPQSGGDRRLLAAGRRGGFPKAGARQLFFWKGSRPWAPSAFPAEDWLPGLPFKARGGNSAPVPFRSLIGPTNSHPAAAWGKNRVDSNGPFPGNSPGLGSGPGAPGLWARLPNTGEELKEPPVPWRAPAGIPGRPWAFPSPILTIPVWPRGKRGRAPGQGGNPGVSLNPTEGLTGPAEAFGKRPPNPWGKGRKASRAALGGGKRTGRDPGAGGPGPFLFHSGRGPIRGFRPHSGRGPFRGQRLPSPRVQLAIIPTGEQGSIPARPEPPWFGEPKLGATPWGKPDFRLGPKFPSPENRVLPRVKISGHLGAPGLTVLLGAREHSGEGPGSPFREMPREGWPHPGGCDLSKGLGTRERGFKDNWGSLPSLGSAQPTLGGCDNYTKDFVCDPPMRLGGDQQRR